MEFNTFALEGPIEVIPKRLGDDRGYFSEIYRADAFRVRAADVNFVQENESLSVRQGTIRGIHFQTPPFAQGKLVRCLSGAIYDVAVDLRHDSPGFGNWIGVTLSAGTGNQLWIPAGFGHAFCSLEANSVVCYRVTAYYSREHDQGLLWNDPVIGIDWPDVADPSTLSAKDQQQPALRDLGRYFSVRG